MTKKSIKIATGLFLSVGTWTMLGGFTNNTGQFNGLSVKAKQVAIQHQAELTYKKKLSTEINRKAIEHQKERNNQETFGQKVKIDFQTVLKQSAQSYVVQQAKKEEQAKESDVQVTGQETAQQSSENTVLVKSESSNEEQQIQPQSSGTKVPALQSGTGEKVQNSTSKESSLSNQVTRSLEENQTRVFKKDDNFSAKPVAGNSIEVSAKAPDTKDPAFKNDPYPYGQCTWYAYGRAKQLGVLYSAQMGNAKDWKNAPGYEVTHTPTLHSVISFAPKQLGADKDYGHVAFVEVIEDDGSVLISESNVVGLGKVSYRLLTADQASQLDYVIGKETAAQTN